MSPLSGKQQHRGALWDEVMRRRGSKQGVRILTYLNLWFDQTWLGSPPQALSDTPGPNQCARD
jgi:hypothetical protein